MDSDQKSIKISEIEENHRITVGDLKGQLKGFSDETEITFGCTTDAAPLIFTELKFEALILFKSN